MIPPIGLALAVLAGSPSDTGSACFDFSRPVVEPLRPPIPLVEGRDNSAHGTYTNGVAWASTRTVLPIPIRSVYAKVLDGWLGADSTAILGGNFRTNAPAFI